MTRIDRKPQAGLKEPQNGKANTQMNDNTSQPPKHLVVTLETTKNRAELLRASQKLKGTTYDRVYIDPDYTPVEAKELSTFELNAGDEMNPYLPLPTDG